MSRRARILIELIIALAIATAIFALLAPPIVRGFVP
jgi:hypothetical protein